MNGGTKLKKKVFGVVGEDKGKAFITQYVCAKEWSETAAYAGPDV